MIDNRWHLLLRSCKKKVRSCVLFKIVDRVRLFCFYRFYCKFLDQPDLVCKDPAAVR